MSKASCQQPSHDEEESPIGKPTKDEPPEHRFKLVLVDGLGKGHVFDFELPYDIEYRGFLLRVEWKFGAQSRVKIHNDSDYVNWAKRLAILPQDDPAVARIQQHIAQYKSTDFKDLAEWMWVAPGKIVIDSQDTFGALMAKAKAGELHSEGCFMRVSLRRPFHTPTLPHCFSSISSYPSTHFRSERGTNKTNPSRCARPSSTRSPPG